MKNARQKAKKLIEEFIQSFGYNAEEDVEFSMDSKTDLIFYTLDEPENSPANVALKRYLKEEFHISIPVLLFSILHEIGHFETLGKITQAEINANHGFKEIIELAYSEYKGDNDYCFFKSYWDLKIEYLANEWAVNFVKSNTEECAEFYGKLKKCIEGLNPSERG